MGRSTKKDEVISAQRSVIFLLHAQVLFLLNISDIFNSDSIFVCLVLVCLCSCLKFRFVFCLVEDLISN